MESDDNQPFSPERYAARFESVRDILRGFTITEILTFGRLYLYVHEPKGEDLVLKKPWVAAQAIKWALLDDHSYAEGGLPKPERAESFRVLLENIWNLTDANRMPSDFGSATLFMRTLAFQQFPFQQNLSLIAIGRQLLLFDEANNPFYNNSLTELIGLNATDFFFMSLCIAAILVNDEDGILHPDKIAGAENRINPEQAIAILRACSVPRERIRDRLLEATDGRANIGTPEEYFDFTPFAEFPFIESKVVGAGGKSVYICLNRNLFYRWVESSVYDILKRNDTDKFMAKFGKTFERYIERLFNAYNYNFLTEEQIIETFGRGGRVADFLVREKDADIFIDAKAVEAAYSGRGTHRISKLLSTLKKVLDAVDQANATRQKVSSVENEIRPAFALVITFRDHYLGSGHQFFGGLAKGEIRKLSSRYGESLIPSGNIFFLSIEDLERLLHGVSTQGLTLTQFLMEASAAEASSTPGQCKFHFKLHLDSARYFQHPVMLQERFDKFFDSIRSRYFECPQASL